MSSHIPVSHLLVSSCKRRANNTKVGNEEHPTDPSPYKIVLYRDTDYSIHYYKLS